MTYPMTGAWSVIARLQNSQILAKSETVESALDAMIDRQIDRIAANHAEADDPAEARRAIATAARRKRHRARLMRLYLVDSASDDRSHLRVYRSRGPMQTSLGKVHWMSRRRRPHYRSDPGWILGVAFETPEASYAARQALTAIFAQASPQDATLLLSVGQGGAPKHPASAPLPSASGCAAFAHVSRI